MNRNQLFWGSVLILVGGLLLAGEMGITLPNGNSLMSIFWPLLLIGFGIWVLLSVFMRGTVETETASVGLQGAREASVQINHGAGEFRIHGGASGADLLNGTFTGGLDQKSNLSGEKLDVRLRPEKDLFMFPVFGPQSQLDWDVSLNATIPTALDLNLGANKSVIDLRDLTITDINLKTGASDTVLTLPARGRLRVNCEVGAASLTLIVPEGVAVRAHATMGAGDFNMDRSRFPKNESPDFETAQNAIDLHVQGRAASVRVK
ncbi:MAG: hypothetical protein J0M11_13810 [Anaerolineae bacterium]|nr:hypothetical protein [Anaerolineae bacterium]